MYIYSACDIVMWWVICQNESRCQSSKVHPYTIATQECNSRVHHKASNSPTQIEKSSRGGSLKFQTFSPCFQWTATKYRDSRPMPSSEIPRLIACTVVDLAQQLTRPKLGWMLEERIAATLNAMCLSGFLCALLLSKAKRRSDAVDLVDGLRRRESTSLSPSASLCKT